MFLVSATVASESRGGVLSHQAGGRVRLLPALMQWPSSKSNHGGLNHSCGKGCVPGGEGRLQFPRVSRLGFVPPNEGTSFAVALACKRTWLPALEGAQHQWHTALASATELRYSLIAASPQLGAIVAPVP